MRPLVCFVFLLCASTVCRPQQVHSGSGHQHDVRSAEQWVQILEGPERDGWQKPDQVVQALRLDRGADIADIGAGSGYFSVRFARAIGPHGTVHAVDIDAGLVEHLKSRAEKEGIPNLKAIHSQPDDPLLEARSVDLIFICDVIHHVENRPAYYAKLARALRPQGRLAIVDFHKRDLPVGPGAAMKIAKADLIAELERAGFSVKEEFDFLPYQYFLVFGPPSAP